MKTVKSFVFTYFRWLFPALALLFILTVTLVLKNNGCLKNEMSPHSVFSLQQAGSKATADLIIRKWYNDSCYCHKVSDLQNACADGTQCNKAIVYARKSIIADFLFIPVYLLLGLALLIRLNCQDPFDSFFNAVKDLHKTPPGWLKWLTQALMALLAVAAVCDVMENIFLLKALGSIHSETNPLDYSFNAFFVPARIKIILLSIVLVYVLIRASAWLTSFTAKTLTLVWRMRIAAFSLLLLGLPLWITDQGQDLLANINDTHSGPIGLFITLTILALLNWHLPKLYTGTEAIIDKNNEVIQNTPQAKDKAFKITQLITRNWDYDNEYTATGQQPREHERKSARMFGILTFLVPACAISNALDAFKANHFFKFISPFVLLAVLTLFFYIVIRYNWLKTLTGYIKKNYNNRKGQLARILMLAAVVLAILQIILPVLHNSSAPGKMTTLQVNLILMAALFLLFTEYRKIKPLRSVFSGITLNRIIWISASACILIFLYLNFDPLRLPKMNGLLFRIEALPLLISAIVFHTVFFSLLLLWGRRFRVDIISIFIVTGLIVTLSGANNFHTVRRVELKDSLAAKDMITFRDYLTGWLLYRKKEIDNFDTSGGRRYPLFLVNSYGGGIRAAAWTSMLMSRIDYLLAEKTNSRLFGDSLPRNFSHYTFAGSGISGGTIGLAVNTAYIYNQLSQPGQRKTIYRDSLRLSRFYQSDFLSPVSTLLLGRDMLASMFRIQSWEDRAAVMEEIWEYQVHHNHIGSFETPFRDIWNRSKDSIRFEVPLLFSNTYYSEAGVQGILAPVRLDAADFPSSVIVNSLNLVQDRDLRLSTAAFLSARFPYITPSGRFDYEHHFIDGGVKEYSGCGTLLNIYRLIEKIRLEDSVVAQLMSKIQVYHFNINNYLPPEEKKKVNNPFEITLPLEAAIQNGHGNTDEVVLLMKDAVGDMHSFKVSPALEYINEKCKDRYSPVLPLGWKISQDALRRMWKSVDMEQRNTASSFSRLMKVFD